MARDAYRDVALLADASDGSADDHPLREPAGQGVEEVGTRQGDRLLARALEIADMRASSNAETPYVRRKNRSKHHRGDRAH